MTKLLRWPLIALLALLCVAAVQRVLQSNPGAPDAAFAMNAPAFGHPDYAALLDASNQRLALAVDRVERAPDQWLPRAGLGAAALSLFRLTGRTDHLDLALDEMARVRQLAPPPSGAPELRAELALVRHDLATARRELDVFARASVAPEAATLSEVAAMRGDIALYSGRHAEAAKHYREAARIDPAIGVAIRQANLLRMEGDFDKALSVLARATREQPQQPATLSSIALQAGAIESARGDYAAAQDWYDRAEVLFPGHWLTALYRAEAQLANGVTEAGIAALEAVAREHSRPEAMDMLALVWRIRGDSERSRAWAAQAGAIWRAWSDKHPSAFAAHAAEHELVFGDPGRALQLAQINARARPFGESRLLLARALLANDRARQALAQVESSRRMGWRSAQMFAIEAQALTILGDADGAAAARAQALALNPRIEDAAARLIWLAHG